MHQKFINKPVMLPGQSQSTFNDKGDVMIEEISLILLQFRNCFSRSAAFKAVGQK